MLQVHANRACTRISFFVSITVTETRAANRSGSQQASYDKQRHRNLFFQTRYKGISKKSKHLLKSVVSWYDQTRIDIELHWSTFLASWISTQKEPFPRSEFTAALNLDALDAGQSPNADILHLIIWLPWYSWIRKGKTLVSINKKNLNVLGDLWKKWWIRNRLHSRRRLCESLKCEEGKDLIIESSPQGCSEASGNKSTQPNLLRRSGEGRGRLKFVCGARDLLLDWAIRAVFLSMTIIHVQLKRVNHMLTLRTIDVPSTWCFQDTSSGREKSLVQYGSVEKMGNFVDSWKVLLRQDPLQAILVIFGRTQPYFIWFETSWKRRKNDTTFVDMRSCDHLGDAKMSKKGTFLRRIYFFLLIAISRNGFRRMKEEGQIYQTLQQIILSFA